MTAIFRAMLVALASVAVLGCHHEPTYYEDIAPILENKCTQCHRSGGVALGPTFDSFATTAAVATKIRHSVQSREMPPWGAENSGLCGTWHDALWLDDDEMRALDRWTLNPLPGDARRAKPVTRKPPPEFHPSGLVLDIGGDYRPWIGPSTFHCFVVDPADARDHVATAFRVTSTEPRSVEHVTIYAIDSAESEAAATALDEESPGLGYTCYGSSRVAGARLLTSWSWGSSVSEMPAGVGVRVPGGRKLIVQIRYNPLATGFDVPTRARIELEVDDHARVANYFSVSPADINLPPGQVHTEVRADVSVPHALRVLGVVPHMHAIGKTLQLDRGESNSFRCMGSFDHWEFSRQRLFSFEKPVELAPRAHLRVSCAFDTRARSAPTRMGDGFGEEECRAELLVLAI
jgi:hypothetical protein